MASTIDNCKFNSLTLDHFQRNRDTNEHYFHIKINGYDNGQYIIVKYSGSN